MPATALKNTTGTWKDPVEAIFLDGLVNTLAEYLDGKLPREASGDFERLVADCPVLREEATACLEIQKLEQEATADVKFSTLDRIRRLAAITEARANSVSAAAAPIRNEAGTPSAVATDFAAPRVQSSGDTLYSGSSSANTIYGSAPALANTSLQRGISLAQQGNYLAAITEFNTVLRSDPTQAAALRARGDAYRDMGDCHRAAADYTAALALGSEDPGLLISRGQSRQFLGQHAAAIADFTQALECSPNSIPAFNHRGQSHEALGQLDQAIVDYSAALSIDPRNAWALQARGQALLSGRKLNEAFADFEELVRQRPRFAVAYALRADARRAKGDLDRAIDDYTEALSLDPRHLPSLIERGLAWRQKGRFERAITDFTSALVVEPRHALVHDHRGMAFRQQGENAKALADFDRAIELDPSQPHFYNHRGNIQFTLGALDAAVADYSRALELKPQFANCLINRGNALFQRGEYSASVKDYAAAIEQDPKLPRAWLNRGMALLRVGQSEAAIADCSEAIARDAKMAQAWCYRGVAQLAIGQREKAIEDLSEAIKLDPKMALAFNERGQARTRGGMFHDALADHSAAIRLEPENSLWHANRALVWQSLEDHERALADYAAAVTLDLKYLAAYAAARARWHESQGQHRFAAADAILALRVDPDNPALARLRETATLAAKPTFDQETPAGIAPVKSVPVATVVVPAAELAIEDDSILADDVSRRRQSRKELGSQIWASETGSQAAAGALNGMINRRRANTEEPLLTLSPEVAPAASAPLKPFTGPSAPERRPRTPSFESHPKSRGYSPTLAIPSISPNARVSIAAGLVIAASLLAAFMFWPSHGESARAMVVAAVPASELVVEFAKDTASANGKYAGQLVTVRGKVQEVVTTKGRPRVVLAGANQVSWSVECSFAQRDAMGQVTPGQDVTLTGTVELRTSFKSHVQLYSCQWGELESSRVAIAGKTP